jgi:hypothetical protein
MPASSGPTSTSPTRHLREPQRHKLVISPWTWSRNNAVAVHFQVLKLGSGRVYRHSVSLRDRPLWDTGAVRAQVARILIVVIRRGGCLNVALNVLTDQAPALTRESPYQSERNLRDLEPTGSRSLILVTHRSSSLPRPLLTYYTLHPHRTNVNAFLGLVSAIVNRRRDDVTVAPFRPRRAPRRRYRARQRTLHPLE